jgi:hypothetical protein
MRDRRATLLTLAVALGALGVALAVWLWPERDWARELSDPDPAARAAAVREMAKRGKQALVVEALRDEHPDVRLLAVTRVFDPALVIEALKDPDAGVRRAASLALAQLSRKGQEPIRQALSDPNPRVRAGAALALRDLRKCARCSRCWRRCGTINTLKCAGTRQGRSRS